MSKKSLEESSQAIGAIILLALLIFILFVLPTHGIAWLLNWIGWNTY